MKDIHRRVRAMACWLVLALAPTGALAVDIIAIEVDQSASSMLGGGIGGGSCLASPTCSDSRTRSGSVSDALPVSGGLSSQTSTTTGTNSVSARASAAVQLREPDEIMLQTDPDAVLFGRIDASAAIRDSKAASFHTSADASISSDDFFDFAVPTLVLGESFAMDVGLIAYEDALTTLFSGSFSVMDITAGQLLASWDDSNTGSTFLDLSGLGGHVIRVSLSADIAISGPEGFGGGVDRLTQRSFDSFFFGHYILHHVTVPEPTTGALTAIGIAVMGMRARRRPNRA